MRMIELNSSNYLETEKIPKKKNKLERVFKKHARKLNIVLIAKSIMGQLKKS